VETVAAALDAAAMRPEGDPLNDFEESAVAPAAVAYAAGPAEPVDGHAAAVVADVLAALDPVHAVALRLAFLGGSPLSTAALGEALGVSKATAARRRSAALEAARAIPAGADLVASPDVLVDADVLLAECMAEAEAFVAAA
jgi:hypothetical protein